MRGAAGILPHPEEPIMFNPDELTTIEFLLRADIERLSRERDAYGDPDFDPTRTTRGKRMLIMPGTSIPEVRRHRRRLQVAIDQRKAMLAKVDAALEADTDDLPSIRTAA